MRREELAKKLAVAVMAAAMIVPVSAFASNAKDQTTPTQEVTAQAENTEEDAVKDQDTQETEEDDSICGDGNCVIMDEDGNVTGTEDISVSDRIDTMKGITEEEKETLKEVYNQIDQLNLDIDELIDDNGDIKAGKQKEIDALEEKEGKLYDSVLTIEQKAAKVEREDYVNTLQGLTQEEKDTVQEYLTKEDELFSKLADVDPESKSADQEYEKLEDQLEKVMDVLDPLIQKGTK